VEGKGICLERKVERSKNPCLNSGMKANYKLKKLLQKLMNLKNRRKRLC